MHIKSWFITVLLLAFSLPAAAQGNLSSIIVDTTPTKNSKELTQKSDLIIYGWADSAEAEYPTGKKIEQYKIVNFVQTIHVKKNLKGASSPIVKVLTTGTDPLPDASSALNNIYPGPLAEGDYICFLRKVPGRADLYSILAGWQGVYPVFEGKTISLLQQGYPEFARLNIEEMEQKIRSVSGR